MDLTSLYRMVASEAPSVPEQMMRGAANQAALQQADESLMAEKRLRDLYARGNPSIQEIGAISPEYAQKVQQFNNEQLMQQMKMMEMQQNMQKGRTEDLDKKQHIFSNIIGTYTEDWLEKHPNPTEADLNQYKHGLGQNIEFIDKAYGYKPDMPLDIHHPSSILTTAEGLGHVSRRQKTMQEAQLRNLPPQKTPEQAFGTIEIDPVTGQQVRKLPLPNSQPNITKQPPTIDLSGMSLADGDTGETVPLTVENLPKLEQIYKKIPDVNVKNNVGVYLNQLRQQGNTMPLAGSVDRATFKGEEAEKVKAGQIKAEEQAADKKAIDAYFRMKPPEQVRDLIKESLAGDVETSLARMAKLFGVSVPGGGPTAALQVITQQLASTSPFAPGSQSDLDYKARLAKIGDPASDEPIENRLMALDEFYRDQEAFVAQKANMSDEELIDAVHNGYLKPETAMAMRKRNAANKGKM